MAMPDPTPQQLSSFIAKTFDLTELHQLCFELDVNHENLPGSGTLEETARELVRYMDRRERLPRLMEMLARERPESYQKTFGSKADTEFRGIASDSLDSARKGETVTRRARFIITILSALILLVAIVVILPNLRNKSNLQSQSMEATPLSSVTTKPSTPQPSITPEPHTSPTVVSTPEPQAGDIRRTMRGIAEVEQVYVPAGSFLMGSEEGRYDEQPTHKVTLNGFWLDRTEVTNAQYAHCVADETCSPPRDDSSYFRDNYYPNNDFGDYPVIHVTWNDAEAFCIWAGGNLPTEAQWEYGARGPESFTYSWGNNDPTCELTNYLGKAGGCVGNTSEVGIFPDGASWVGALDMVGNVWEWVNDWYQDDYYTVSPSTNPLGPESGTYRVMRGGSWDFEQHAIRASFRNILNYPWFAGYNVGFRCAHP